MQSKLLMVEGRLQVEGELIHVIVARCFDYSRLLQRLTSGENTFTTSMSRSDETTAPVLGKSLRSHEVIQGNIFPEGRNFR